MAVKLLPQVDLKAEPYEAGQGAGALVILTEWDQFRALDLDRAKAATTGSAMIDLRNIYRPPNSRGAASNRLRSAEGKIAAA